MITYKLLTIIFVVTIGLIIFAASYPSVYEPQYKKNQYQVVTKMLRLISDEVKAKEETNSFKLYNKTEIDSLQGNGYKIEFQGDQRSFQIWAIPNEYGKTGEISYYAESSDGDVHGTDHQGEQANLNDPVIQSLSVESKSILRESKSLSPQITP